MKVICDHAQGCKLKDCPHIKKHDNSLDCQAMLCTEGKDETMDCSKCKEALLKRVQVKFNTEVSKSPKVTSYKATLLLHDIIQEELKK